MARKRTPRRRLGARPRVPHALEKAYGSELKRLVRALVKETARVVAPHLARARAADAREDADLAPDFIVAMRRLGPRLRAIAERMAPGITARTSKRISGWSHEDMARVLRIDLTREPPAVRALLTAWRRDNVDLITSIAQRLGDDVLALVTEAADSGMRVETLADRIEERYGVTESRAELIARDQVLKANSDLTQSRHEEAGITSYVWSTSRDERVRPMHADLEGQEFTWAEPPVTNREGDENPPGRDYQCRCTAIPVIPGFET